MTRRRTPTVLQLEAAECGAAALAMVLGHHGRFEPLATLRRLCGVSRDGAKASSIVRAARALGLEARGLKAEPHHLPGLALPAIAFVDFNHFVVVERADTRRVWLNDPAFGRRSQPIERFSEHFTGVVLTFQPGRGFVAGDARPSALAALRRHCAGVGDALRLALLVSLVLVVPGIVLPAFSRILVDEVLIRDQYAWLPALAAGMALTALVRFVLLEVQGRALLAARAGMTLDRGRALMAKLLSLPLGFFDQRYAGEIAERVRLNEALAGLLTGRLAEAVVSLVTAVFLFGMMLLYTVPLTLAVGALGAANAAVLFLSDRILAERFHKIAVDRGKLAGARVAGFRDMETFKASGAEDMLFARWIGLERAAINGEQAAARVRGWTAPVPDLLNGLAVATILVWGGWLVMRGHMTLGALVGYQTLAASFLAPVAALVSFGAELTQVRSCLARLDDVLAEPADQRFDRPEPPQADRVPQGAVALAGITFGFAPLGPPLIDALSLAIRPGERIALVGASGSGKTTLAKLVAGLEHPSIGEVLIDGRPLLDWPRELMARRLAFVRQEPTLFAGSVRDNLTLWDPRIGEAAMIRAAQDAQIHESIAARPGGYGGEIREGGLNFSGGERQRLEIARALATDPAILVLDEATSALDALTEHRIMAAIRRRGLTCVIVAHRLSTVRDCDRIVVIESGRIVEMGNHRALLVAGGAYVRLIAA